MPIQKRWSNFDKEIVEKVPTHIGVYEIGNRLRNEIKIGKARDLHRRLLEHLQSDDIGKKGKYFRYEVTKGWRRAGERERALQRQFRSENGRLPEFDDRIG